MPIRIVISILSVLLALMVSSPTVNAQIFFSPVLVTGDSDVLNTGTTVIAYDVSGTAASVHGVNFSGSTTNGTATLTFANLPFSDNNGVDGTHLSLALTSVLIDNIFSGSTATLTFNNLTPGQAYTLQIFDGTTGVGFGNTQVQDGSATGTLPYGISGSDSTAYYVIEQFTAGLSGTEIINMNPIPGSGFVIVDAVNLRTIPEPSVYALLLASLGALLAMRRFRSKSDSIL